MELDREEWASASRRVPVDETGPPCCGASVVVVSGVLVVVVREDALATALDRFLDSSFCGKAVRFFPIRLFDRVFPFRVVVAVNSVSSERVVVSASFFFLLASCLSSLFRPFARDRAPVVGVVFSGVASSSSSTDAAVAATAAFSSPSTVGDDDEGESAAEKERVAGGFSGSLFVPRRSSELTLPRFCCSPSEEDIVDFIRHGIHTAPHCRLHSGRLLPHRDLGAAPTDPPTAMLTTHVEEE